jgi:hypothetical protein
MPVGDGFDAAAARFPDGDRRGCAPEGALKLGLGCWYPLEPTQPIEDGRKLADKLRSRLELSDRKALRELGKVKASWTLETVGDLVPHKLDGKDVLVREPRLRSRPGWAQRGPRRRRTRGDRLAA